MPRGWYSDRMKHRLASKGIKTKTSPINFNSQGKYLDKFVEFFDVDKPYTLNDYLREKEEKYGDYGTLYYSENEQRYWVLYKNGKWGWVNGRFDTGRYPDGYNTRTILSEFKILFKQPIEEVVDKEPNSFKNKINHGAMGKKKTIRTPTGFEVSPQKFAHIIIKKFNGKDYELVKNIIINTKNDANKQAEMYRDMGYNTIVQEASRYKSMSGTRGNKYHIFLRRKED